MFNVLLLHDYSSIGEKNGAVNKNENKKLSPLFTFPHRRNEKKSVKSDKLSFTQIGLLDYLQWSVVVRMVLMVSTREGSIVMSLFPSLPFARQESSKP